MLRPTGLEEGGGASCFLPPMRVAHDMREIRAQLPNGSSSTPGSSPHASSAAIILHQQLDWEGKAVQDEMKLRFARLSTAAGLVEKNVFNKVIGVEDRAYADLLYDTLMREQPGRGRGLRLDYIIERLGVGYDPLAGLSLIFSMCDEKGAGEIGVQELAKALGWTSRVNKLQLSREELERMAFVILEHCNVHHKDTINVEDFVSLLKTDEQLSFHLTHDFPIGSAPDFQKAVAAKRPKNTMGKEAKKAPQPQPQRSLATVGPATPGTQRLDDNNFMFQLGGPDGDGGSLSVDSIFNLSQRSNDTSWDSSAHTRALISSSTKAPRGRQAEEATFSGRLSHMSRSCAYLLTNYWSDMVMLYVYAVFVSLVFLWRFFSFMTKDDFRVLRYGICITKGAAEALKFNFALILLPVCGRTVTFLRTKLLGFFPAFDRNLEFHKLIAGSITVATAIHVGGHLFYNFPKIIDPGNAAGVSQNLKWALYHGRPPTFWELCISPTGLSGIAMVITMLIAFPLALKNSRKYLQRVLPGPLKVLASFNGFWLTHHLLLINYILLIWHGTRKPWGRYPTHSAWKYIAGPVLLYTCERLLRFYNGHVRWGQVEVTKAVLHPGNVLALHMVRPSGFNYKSGMYVYLHCSEVSRFEWHPFTMTSCPFDDEIVVHIKKGGDWTASLHKVFQERLEMAKQGPVVQITYTGGRVVTHPVKNNNNNSNHNVSGRSSQFGTSPSGSSGSSPRLTTQWNLSATPPTRNNDNSGYCPPPPQQVCRGQPSITSATEFQSAQTHYSITEMIPASASPVWQQQRRHSIFVDPENPVLPIQLGPRLFPRICLDGPFGAPSQEWRRYQVLLLVGAGIGVTPFASILQELLSRIEIKQLHPYRPTEDEPRPDFSLEEEELAAEQTASKKHLERALRKGEDMKAFQTQKVYVVWTTRDQASLTWFRDRMDNLSAFDRKGVIELHQYLTGVPHDARSLMLKLGQSLAHRRSGVDPITGMRTKVATHFGRPNWDVIFKKLVADHPQENVGIFFCGPNPMAQELATRAKKYSTAEGSTTWFDFRKEIF